MCKLRLPHFLILITPICCSPQALGQSPRNLINQKQSILRHRITETAQAVAEREKQIAEMKFRLQEFAKRRQELLEHQDKAGISPEAFPEILQLLQTQQVELNIDLAGLEARSAKLQELQTSSNELTAKQRELEMSLLQQQIELMQKHLEQIRMLAERKLVSSEEVDRAELELAQAQLELEQTKLGLEAGQSRFVDELLAIELEKAEKEAKLAKGRDILGKLMHSRNDLSTLENLEVEHRTVLTTIDQLRDQLQSEKQQLRRLKKQIEQIAEFESEDE